jgi:hypothetical protein
MALQLLAAAQKFLVGKAWSSELVLRMGVELLSVAHSLPNLSFQDKSSLVCQTILRMLDDAEKAGKEHLAESTGIMPTTAQLEHYKTLVHTALPVCLELANILLPAQCVPPMGCLPRLSWGCVRKEVVDTVTAVEDVLKHPQEYLEEMRDLVSKVEKLLSVASEPLPVASEPVPVVSELLSVNVPVPESVPVAVVNPEPIPEPISETLTAAESLLEPRPRLPPSPELSAEQLPGGLATPEEVELSL